MWAGLACPILSLLTPALGPVGLRSGVDRARIRALGPWGLTYRCLAPFPLPIGNHRFVLLSVSLFLCCYIHLFVLFLDSTHKQLQNICFSLWFVSLSIIPSRSIHIVANGKSFILFYGWVVFHCVYVFHIFFIYSSVDGYRLLLITYLLFLIIWFLMSHVDFSDSISIFYNFFFK